MQPAGTVPLRERALREIRSVVAVTLFFGSCFLVMMVCKALVLAEYGVEFRGISFALVAALIVAKVVLVLEKVPLGSWVRSRPVVVDVALRTALYALGVAVVLVLERAFESRHEHGGFTGALDALFRNRDIHRIVATTIGVGGALLAFNVLAVLGEHLGVRYLARLFFTTPRAELKHIGPGHGR